MNRTKANTIMEAKEQRHLVYLQTNLSNHYSVFLVEQWSGRFHGKIMVAYVRCKMKIEMFHWMHH